MTLYTMNKKFKIRDLRNGDWYWIHKIIYKEYSSKIGATGLALYNAYAYYANKGECFPTQKTIAKKLNVSERTIQKFNKILEDNGLIKIESGKTKGTANEIYLLKVRCETDSYPSENSSHPGTKQIRTNKNNINKNKLTISLSKEREGNASPFGNQDINFLISFLKKEVSLKKLDGSEKQNRRYCWLCLKKFGSRRTVENLIRIAVSSNFHFQNLTSFRYLYNHGVKIANELRGKRSKVAIIK